MSMTWFSAINLLEIEIKYKLLAVVCNRFYTVSGKKPTVFRE